MCITGPRFHLSSPKNPKRIFEDHDFRKPEALFHARKDRAKTAAPSGRRVPAHAHANGGEKTDSDEVTIGVTRKAPRNGTWK